MTNRANGGSALRLVQRTREEPRSRADDERLAFAAVSALLAVQGRTAPADPDELARELADTGAIEAGRLSEYVREWLRTGRLRTVLVHGRTRLAMPSAGHYLDVRAGDATDETPFARRAPRGGARRMPDGPAPASTRTRPSTPTEPRPAEAPSVARALPSPRPERAHATALARGVRDDVRPAAPVGPRVETSPSQPSTDAAPNGTPKRPLDEEAPFELQVAVDVEEERVVVRRFAAVFLAIVLAVLVREWMITWSETWR